MKIKKMEAYPPRPVTTLEMKLDAAIEVAKKHDWGGADVDEVADDIAHAYSPGMDGYELAKKLDDWHGWEIGRGDIDALEDMLHEVRGLLVAAEQNWITDNNIEPPLPIGTAIDHPHVDGVITSLCSYRPGFYLVKPDGQDDGASNNRRVLVSFEQAEENVKQEATA